MSRWSTPRTLPSTSARRSWPTAFWWPTRRVEDVWQSWSRPIRRPWTRPRRLTSTSGSTETSARMTLANSALERSKIRRIQKATDDAIPYQVSWLKTDITIETDEIRNCWVWGFLFPSFEKKQTSKK